MLLQPAVSNRGGVNGTCATPEMLSHTRSSPAASDADARWCVTRVLESPGEQERHRRWKSGPGAPQSALQVLQVILTLHRRRGFIS